MQAQALRWGLGVCLWEKRGLLGPRRPPGHPDSAGLGQGPRVLISNKRPGDAAAQRPHLEFTLVRPPPPTCVMTEVGGDTCQHEGTRGLELSTWIEEATRDIHTTVCRLGLRVITSFLSPPAFPPGSTHRPARSGEQPLAPALASCPPAGPTPREAGRGTGREEAAGDHVSLLRSQVLEACPPVSASCAAPPCGRTSAKRSSPSPHVPVTQALPGEAGERGCLPGAEAEPAQRESQELRGEKEGGPGRAPCCRPT